MRADSPFQINITPHNSLCNYVLVVAFLHPDNCLEILVVSKYISDNVLNFNNLKSLQILR